MYKCMCAYLAVSTEYLFLCVANLVPIKQYKIGLFNDFAHVTVL